MLSQFLRVLLGLLFALVGVVAAVTTILGVVGVDSSGAGLQLAAFAAASILALWVGLRLIRGKRSPVLFLRRFGFADATAMLTYAVATTMGNRWRLITLDDAEVVPVGVPSGRRWGLGIVALAGIVGAAVGLFWVFGGGAEDFMTRLIDDYVRQNDAEGIEDTIETLFGALFSSLVLGLFAVVGVLLLVTIAAIGAVLSFGSYASVRRAERSRRSHIRDVGDIDPVVRRTGARSRAVFSPRLMVVNVERGLWHQTVERLAASTVASIVDVSEPTDSLEWEIATLMSAAGSRWVLVGRRDRVESLAGVIAGDDGPASRLVALIDGEEVLIYETGDKNDMKRFVRVLRQRLRHVSRSGTFRSRSGSHSPLAGSA